MHCNFNENSFYLMQRDSIVHLSDAQLRAAKDNCSNAVFYRECGAGHQEGYIVLPRLEYSSQDSPDDLCRKLADFVCCVSSARIEFSYTLFFPLAGTDGHGLLEAVVDSVEDNSRIDVNYLDFSEGVMLRAAEAVYDGINGGYTQFFLIHAESAESSVTGNLVNGYDLSALNVDYDASLDEFETDKFRIREISGLDEMKCHIEGYADLDKLQKLGMEGLEECYYAYRDEHWRHWCDRELLLDNGGTDGCLSIVYEEDTDVWRL